MPEYHKQLFSEEVDLESDKECVFLREL